MDMLFQILSAVLGLATLLFGGYLAKVKSLVKEGEDVIKAIEDVFEVSGQALADNKLTAAEAKEIFKKISGIGVEAKEFLVALRLLFNLKRKK